MSVTTLAALVLFFGSLLSAHGAAQEKESPPSWRIELRGDQQESFGYSVNVGYRLPTLMKLPGLFLNAGVWERFFPASTPSAVDTLKATSWNIGTTLMAPVHEAIYLSQSTRLVGVRLPEQASERTLKYLEVGFGIGVGASQGFFVEMGTNLRSISELKKPITLGSTVIDHSMSIYPSMSLGYRI